MATRRHRLTLALCALACSALPFPGGAQEEPALAIVDAGVDRASRMTVPVTIDGQGPYPFVVDTGSDRTVVSRELATALNLPQGRAARMHSMSGVGSVDTVTVSRLRVAGAVQEPINAPALAELHLGAKGLLGVDSLQGRRVVMDFRKRTLAVFDAKKRERVEPDTIVVTARSRYGQLILVDAAIGGTPITVIIDSGAENTIGNAALRAMLEKRRRVLQSYPTTLIDVTGGRLPADVAVVNNVRIGGFTMSSVSIAFADAHPFKRFGLSDTPAMLLGMDTLRIFDRVSVDFAARKVRFLLPQDA